MKFKLIIFDFDGTLADTFPWFAANINKAAALFYFRRVVQEDYDKLRGLNSQQLLKHLGISWWKIPFISIYMRKLMARNLSGIKLFKDMELLLEKMEQQNVQLAIVSSNSSENIKTILGDKARYFSYFECRSSLFGKHKKFIQLLNKTNASPAETLAIGDEIRDIEAAKLAGIYSGAVTWGYALPEALKAADPDFLFTSAEDVVGKIFL